MEVKREMLIYKNDDVVITSDPDTGEITTLYRKDKTKNNEGYEVTKRYGRYWGYISEENIDDLIKTLTKELKIAKKEKEREAKNG